MEEFARKHGFTEILPVLCDLDYCTAATVKNYCRECKNRQRKGMEESKPAKENAGEQRNEYRISCNKKWDMVS